MSKLDDILGDFDTWCMCGKAECVLAENFRRAKQDIKELFAEIISKQYELTLTDIELRQHQEGVEIPTISKAKLYKAIEKL